ncbi:extracellular solute-binding protein [Cohnella lubricantis]|uniref:Extracellular solute-binding protein n=1 Tax=Cohnella lubricantis TaxID=2163172 RepID=A0A841TJL0_9BACL|nr:extracellular solute-binding protein [Cohnella lubricantis]MBB6679117.1 extracellular solute-binding protein [Cohnella lubricantis]MBP2120190.1 ABC-type glycerol-3-phosphate transport system substrate-binding protein [Cohnella lubricantis]
MQRIKLPALLLSAAMLGALVTACSNNNDGGGASSSSSPSGQSDSSAPSSSASASASADTSDEKVTIKIYYPTADKPELRAIEDAKIARFEAKYPNVTVVPDDWQYNVNEIGPKMAANEAPTFFNTFATEAKMLVEKGWAADITDLWNNYEHKDDINPVLQNQFNLDGKVYGVTQNGYVSEVVINKKMLADKGIALPSYDWTWDDFYNIAQQAADPKKGIAGVAPMAKGNDGGWNWTNFLFEAGGEIQTVADGKVTAAFNSDAGVKALDFYKKLRWEANAVPQDWALDWGGATGAFAQGRAAMVIAGADGPLQQALQAGLKPEDLAVYPMPAAQAGGKHTGVLGGNYLVVNPNASPAEQQAAFNYIVFDYYSDDALVSLEQSIKDLQAKGQYYVPPHMDYYKPDSEYGKKVQDLLAKYDNAYKYDPAEAALLDGKPEAQYNTQEYYGIITNAIQEVFTKKDADAKTLLDNAAQEMQSKYYDAITVQ